MDTVKYQRSDVVGEEWMRANRIIFENPPTGDFKVRFAEERAVMLADGTVMSKPMGVLEDSCPQDQLDQSFELIDPTTGEGTGAHMTYAQLHSALYSMYLKASQAHHGTAPVEETEVPPPTE